MHSSEYHRIRRCNDKIGRFGTMHYRHNETVSYYLMKHIKNAHLDNKVKSYDNELHQSLSNIFSERCLTSDQIKEFVRAPAKHIDENSIISLILKREPIISVQYPNGEFRELSLLWIAVLCCYQNTAELLVRSGADVNEPFGRHDPEIIDEKWTILHVLLHMRASPENERLVRLVTDHGADLQTRDSYDRTILHFAVAQRGRGTAQQTEMLLEKGARNLVNVVDNLGQSALFAAVRSREVDKLLPLLIKHGADFKVRRSRDNSSNILHHISNFSPRNMDMECIVRTLIEGGVSLEEESRCYQPIHLAAISGRHKLVKLYLDLGADVNSRAACKMHPFIYIVVNEPAVLSILLERGADVHARTSDFCNRTALHKACCSFNNESIRLLLLAGASVLTEAYMGRTPFSEIDEKNMEEPSVKLIIKTLALEKACFKPSIELKDERRIEQYPQLWDYYQDCHAHISKMKFTKLIKTCTFFELLTKSNYQIAALMRNRDFEANFRLYDLNGFSMYAEDILRVFELAKYHCHSELEQENVIDEAVYNVLPHVVVRKVVQYMFNFHKNVKL